MAHLQLIEAVRQRLEHTPTRLGVEIDGISMTSTNRTAPADIALFTGQGRVVIYVRGESIATVQEASALQRLFEEIRELSGEADSDSTS